MLTVRTHFMGILPWRLVRRLLVLRSRTHAGARSTCVDRLLLEVTLTELLLHLLRRRGCLMELLLRHVLVVRGSRWQWGLLADLLILTGHLLVLRVRVGALALLMGLVRSVVHLQGLGLGLAALKLLEGGGFVLPVGLATGA